MNDELKRVLAERWKVDDFVTDFGVERFVYRVYDTRPDVRRPDAGYDDWIDEHHTRARVIGAAPEAVAMLLAWEWAGEDLNNYRTWKVCLACGNEGPDEEDPSRDVGQHAPDCRWLLLMKKAGLR